MGIYVFLQKTKVSKNITLKIDTQTEQAKMQFIAWYADQTHDKITKLLYLAKNKTPTKRGQLMEKEKDNKKDQNQLYLAEKLRKSGIPNGVIAEMTKISEKALSKG